MAGETIRSTTAIPHVTRDPERGDWIPVGGSAVVLTAETLEAWPDATMTWTNEDIVAAVVLTAAIVDTDPSPPEASPTPRPSPSDPPPVLGTFTATGTGPAGQPSRITVRDRSGRVIGVRIPSDAELRSWTPSRGGGAGPFKAVGRDTFDLLVRWSGSGCGPIVTLTVERGLRSMRLMDRSPGCDASAMAHWMALRLLAPGGLEARSIPITAIRRFPR